MKSNNKVISQQRRVLPAQQHFLSVLFSRTELLRRETPARGRRKHGLECVSPSSSPVGSWFPPTKFSLKMSSTKAPWVN